MTPPEHVAVVELAGETLWLHPARAVFWPERRWLWVADLHWGKDASFRAEGIPLPEGGLERDLERLARLCEVCKPERLLLLGDLIHARTSLHPEVVAKVARWRERHPLPLTLVEGNHDRHAKELPASWKIARGETKIVKGPFVFQHHPEASE